MMIFHGSGVRKSGWFSDCQALPSGKLRRRLVSPKPRERRRVRAAHAALALGEHYMSVLY